MLKTLSPFIFLLLSASTALAQKHNWQNLDLREDSVFGISTEKAYRELLQHKKAQTVIVAVIDGGVDTAHEDLERVIWENPKEISGNGKDDDHNGYADDTHGWDFIGGAKGDVDYDNLELVRVIRRDRTKYENLTDSTVSPADRAGFEKYKKMIREWKTALDNDNKTLHNVMGFREVLDHVTARIGKDTPTLADFEKYIPQDAGETRICRVMIAQLKRDPDFIHLRDEDLGGALRHFHALVDYQLNIDFDPRPVVGDDYANGEQHFYGNNDVKGPKADHGTHVAGIVGADRENAIGVKGVADHVRIMCIRVVPDGDERDKDVANGIRYAADNGAKVINMSFGKGYSWNKGLVDEAVRYAISKDVLLVHAAGNEGNDLATNDNFPNRVYADGSGKAAAWIEVGATGYADDSTLLAPFSNYGKDQVDVFAPGVSIYSTIPGSRYASFEGTSMASPVVAGLAALIREYYPRLTALQVKDIILQSVVKPGHTVTVTVAGEPKQVHLSDISVSGGIVNAYQALKLAEDYK